MEIVLEGQSMYQGIGLKTFFNGTSLVFRLPLNTEGAADKALQFIMSLLSFYTKMFLF
jgi:hypothetical protein